MKHNRFFHAGLYVETLRQLRLMGGIYLALCLLFTVVPALLDSLGSATQPQIDEFAPPLFLFVFVAPVTLAFSAFGYLTRRNASDFYHALPMTRLALYVSRGAAVLSYLVGTILLSLLAAALTYLLCGRPFNAAYLPSQFFYFSACALLVLGCALLGVTVTGTLFSAFVVTGIVLYLPRFVCVLACSIISGIAPIFYVNELGPFFNFSLNLPAAATAKLLTFGAIGGLSLPEMMTYGAGALYTAVLGLLYAALAAWLHSLRPAELAGHSAPNRLLQHVYRCALSLPLFLVLGTILSSEDWSLRYSDAVVFWPLFVLGLAVYFVYELITTRKLRSLLPALCVLPAVLLIGLGVPPLAHAYGEHLLRDVPAAEEIAAVNLGVDDGSLSSYPEMRIAALDLSDEDVVSLAAEALDKTVARYTGGEADKIAYEGAYFTGIGVRFHLKSGGTITRRLTLTESDVDRLHTALLDSPAFLAAVALPPADTILSVDGPGWNQQDDRAFFEDYRAEYESLTPEEQLDLQIGLPIYATGLDDDSEMPDSGLTFSVSGVEDGRSYYATYAITEKTPQMLLRAMQRINEESGAVAGSLPNRETPQFALSEIEALLRGEAVEGFSGEMAAVYDPESESSLLINADFCLYDPGQPRRAFSIQLNLGDAVPTDYDGLEDTAPTGDEVRADALELLELLLDCDAKITSLDESVLCLSYFLAEDYSAGYGYSVQTVYFRLTPEQRQHLLALTDPYRTDKTWLP